MNEADRLEVEQIKERQQLLRHQLNALGIRIDELEAHLSAPAPAVVAEEKTEIGMPEPPPVPAPLLTVPPIIAIPPPVVIEPVQEKVELHPAAQIIAAPPIIAAGPAAPEIAAIGEQSRNAEPPVTFQLPEVPATIPETISQKPSAPAPKASFELRLGTYWMVRVGIVVLLTGLVFLGNYAYENFVGKLGPAGKISLLYFASLLLLGAGGWLQRNAEKESIRNYGQVIFAGGLAAVYFTTYAGHYVPNLRIIASPLLDGLVLLLWTALIVWLADRKKSEVLALFAIGLAYYTSAVTNIGLFTLYSNLVLTAAAVWFLLRNRWATLSIVSLAATYGGFAYWRFYHDGQFLWNWHHDELHNANIFLAGYWILFTAAVFLLRQEKFAHGKRTTFLSANNIAFFGLVIASMFFVRTGAFWKFSLGFGTALLGLAALSKRLLPNEPLVKNTYLTQGLLLVTVGFIAYFTGLKLGLVLAAESVALLTLSYHRGNGILRISAITSGALALVWGTIGMLTEPQLVPGMGIGALLAFNAFWSSRNDSRENALRPLPTYFSLLALLLWLLTDWKCAPTAWFASTLAIESVAFVGLFYLLKTRELTLLGQLYLVGAQMLWLMNSVLHLIPVQSWWHPLILIAASLISSHWWQRQKSLHASTQVSRVLQAIYALAFVAILFFWLHPIFRPNHWLAFSSLLALAITFYGVKTRAWFIAACGQTFLFISGSEFVHQLLSLQPAWYFTLTPIAVLLATAWLAVTRFSKEMPAELEPAESVIKVSFVYLVIAVVMSLWWIHAYIPMREQVWSLTLVATLIFSGGGWWKKSSAVGFSFVYFIAAFVDFLYLPAEGIATIYWPNLLSILAVLTLQQLAKRMPARFNISARLHSAMVLFGGIFLWLFVSRAFGGKADGRYLPLSWSLLAAFFVASEFKLCEKAYRWLGFGLVGWAVALVVYHCVSGDPVDWINLVPIIFALGLQQLTRRLSDHYQLQSGWHTAMVLIGGTVLWLFLSQGVRAQTEFPFLVFSWSLLAILFLAAEFVLREESYRWLGFALVGVALACVVFHGMWLDSFYWPNLLPIVLVLGLQQLARNRPQHYRLPSSAQSAMIAAGGVSLWLFVSRWVYLDTGSSLYLTVAWAILAFVVFAAGFGLRERVYRWLGLAILACSLGRVFLLDVWRLQTIYRILSFMALGLVLLALGFIYNKYQEKIREWL